MSFGIDGYEDTRRVAEILGLSPATLAQWRSQGKGPPYTKIGNRIVYRITSVYWWLEQQERHPGRKPAPLPPRSNG